MAKKMGYNSLDELVEEIQNEEIHANDSFEIAYNLYSSSTLKIYSKNYLKL